MRAKEEILAEINGQSTEIYNTPCPKCQHRTGNHISNGCTEKNSATLGSDGSLRKSTNCSCNLTCQDILLNINIGKL